MVKWIQKSVALIGVKVLLWLIIGYQRFVSPYIAVRCRFYPSCSAYGKTALQWHGFCYGGGLLLRRLLRCHPFGGSGIDFVPLPLYRFIFVPAEASVMIWRSVGGYGVWSDHFSYVARLKAWLS